jgi:hypothetical protein
LKGINLFCSPDTLSQVGTPTFKVSGEVLPLSGIATASELMSEVVRMRWRLIAGGKGRAPAPDGFQMTVKRPGRSDFLE